MSFDIKLYRSKLEDLKSRKKFLQEQIDNCSLIVESKRKELDSSVKARKIIIDVSLTTQQYFVNYVQSLVTMVIRAVFERDFYFIVNYENKRNKSECELLVKEGEEGVPFVPKNEMGGGLLDVISIALRVVVWSLMNPQSRPIMFLDEPMKFVGSSGGMLEKTMNMIKEISERLGIQFIINTHEKEIFRFADKSYLVVHNGICSNVVQLDINSGIDNKKLKRRNIRINT